MDIADWRQKIDELDLKIVALLSERAHAALEIGKLKRCSALPVYEPNRERVVFDKVRAINPGPLPDIELTHIYERIIDVMRTLQKDLPASEATETGKQS
jgi:chorismate mutase